MNNELAVTAFSALAYDTRLKAVQALIAVGESGLPAGELSRRLGVPQNTLSDHLHALARAAIVTAERQGRSIIYRANKAKIDSVASFLQQLTEVKSD